MPLLFGLMAISLVATLLILVAPPLVLGTRLPPQPRRARLPVYFLFIGAGYILIEVGTDSEVRAVSSAIRPMR